MQKLAATAGFEFLKHVMILLLKKFELCKEVARHRGLWLHVIFLYSFTAVRCLNHY